MTEVKFRSDMGVEVLDIMGDDSKIAHMARASTRNEGSTRERDAALVQTLVNERHMLPLEHAAFTFRLQVPIFVARQIQKHRMASQSELSARYTELLPEFYIPSEGRPLGQQGSRMAYEMVHLEGRAEEDARRLMELSAKSAWHDYETLLDRGVSREMARIVLPVNVYTEIRMTMNLRSLLNFLSLRVDWEGRGHEHVADPGHPQQEIDQVASQMWGHLIDNFPAVAGAFEAKGFSA